MIEAISSSKTLDLIRVTWRYIQEDGIPKADCDRNEEDMHNTLERCSPSYRWRVRTLFHQRRSNTTMLHILPHTLTHTHTHFHHGSPVQQDNIHQTVNPFACNFFLKGWRHITDAVQESIHKHIEHCANAIRKLRLREQFCVITLVRINKWMILTSRQALWEALEMIMASQMCDRPSMHLKY
jgi:hypothetical protein